MPVVTPYMAMPEATDSSMNFLAFSIFFIAPGDISTVAPSLATDTNFSMVRLSPSMMTFMQIPPL